MSHFKTVCPICETVITQCRCMSPNKTINYIMCEKCRDKQAAEDIEAAFEEGIENMPELKSEEDIKDWIEGIK